MYNLCVRYSGIQSNPIPSTAPSNYDLPVTPIYCPYIEYANEPMAA